ncbi:MAG TPA: 7-carboxy-7-deazaguanine synthase QueE [Ktedonobacterales bacterium]|nr:7-carboxy-7-deazaguanine synthase QueE [Ktedonobacterales bacterium]
MTESTVVPTSAITSRPAARTTLLRVSEQFISIQGEGPDIGRPFSFIRLFGCNYYCSWCDTKYAVQHWSDTYYERTPADLTAWADEQGNEAVCLTGGEPLTAPAHLFLDLVRRLKASGHYIDIQTNGTIFRPALAALIDSWSISPKLGSSQMVERPDILRRYLASQADGTLRGRMLLKFVIANQRDLDLTWNLLESLPEVAAQQIPIVLQPEGMAQVSIADYAAALRWLTESVAIGDGASRWRAYALRVLPQLHRVIWGGKRGI